jgi:hypothetical protein
MPAKQKRGSGPGDWVIMSIGIGMLLGVLAMVCYTFDHTAGLIALGVAGTVTSVGIQVGVIAKGVEVGIRSARDRT